MTDWTTGHPGFSARSRCKTLTAIADVRNQRRNLRTGELFLSCFPPGCPVSKPSKQRCPLRRHDTANGSGQRERSGMRNALTIPMSLLLVTAVLGGGGDLTSRVSAQEQSGPQMSILVHPKSQGHGTARAIQEAIDRVPSGGQVLVLPGTYAETAHDHQGAHAHHDRRQQRRRDHLAGSSARQRHRNRDERAGNASGVDRSCPGSDRDSRRWPGGRHDRKLLHHRAESGRRGAEQPGDGDQRPCRWKPRSPGYPR